MALGPNGQGRALTSSRLALVATQLMVAWSPIRPVESRLERADFDLLLAWPRLSVVQQCLHFVASRLQGVAHCLGFARAGHWFRMAPPGTRPTSPCSRVTPPRNREDTPWYRANEAWTRLPSPCRPQPPSNSRRVAPEFGRAAPWSRVTAPEFRAAVTSYDVAEAQRW
jgi:hypothetical protein